MCSCADTDKSVLKLWGGAVFKVIYVSVVSVGEDMGRRFFCVLDHFLGPNHHPRQCIPKENGCGMELTGHLHLIPI